MTHLFTHMGIRHSPRTAYSPWTIGLVEVRNRNLGTHPRMYLHDTPKDWVFHVHMYATLNLFQNSMFLLMKLFFTHNPENYLLLIWILTETHLNFVILNNVLNFQNTLFTTKQTYTLSFIELSQHLFHYGFSQ